MQRGFDGKAFIENLIDNLPGGIKILITSRNCEGYFNEIKATIDLTIATINWTNPQIKKWCDKYSQVHKRKKKWCNNFLSKYINLKNDDKRKDIFCIPIILYICCVSEINIGEHNSVAGIYDSAFKKIGEREHSRRNRSTKLTESDKRLLDINWQYTKELAFQMFLNDTLESSLDNDLVNAAKNMTAKIFNVIEDDIQPETDRYYAVFHFVSKNSEGIEFAHKTVGEYFTAVKLYEDYFANTLTDMSNESIEEMWKNIFQAFRYKKIPKDIMEYFVELLNMRIITNYNIKKNNKFDEWRENFINCYYKGIQEELLWKMTNSVGNYIVNEHFLLPDQVAIAFRNLTWLLSMIGFNNSDIKSDCDNYKRSFESLFSHNINMDVNLHFWQNLCKLNLSNIKLIYSDLNTADLRDTVFNGSDLRNADLYGADLRGTYINGTNNKIIELVNLHLLESDLPKYDALIKQQRIKLVEPIIEDIDSTKYSYNSDTNRVELDYWYRFYEDEGFEF